MTAKQRHPSPTASHDGTVPAIDESHANDYVGGKGQRSTAAWILATFPQHTHYAEPFAGHAGVWRIKPPALHTWLIDRDDEVIAWLKAHTPDRANSAAVTIAKRCGLTWLYTHAPELPHTALVYIDPPYHPATRASKARYRYELTAHNHQEMLVTVRGLTCMVAISGYAHPDYDQALKDWTRLEREVTTRGNTKATEVLWHNFTLRPTPPPMEMQYFQLGHDYRERERVAKKVKRWLQMYEAQGEQERRAILLALLNSEQTRTPALEPHHPR